MDLDSIVDKHIEPMITMGTEKSVKVAPNEHYLPFVLFALLSFVGIAWSGTRPKREE